MKARGACQEIVWSHWLSSSNQGGRSFQKFWIASRRWNFPYRVTASHCKCFGPALQLTGTGKASVKPKSTPAGELACVGNMESPRRCLQRLPRAVPALIPELGLLGKKMCLLGSGFKAASSMGLERDSKWHRGLCLLVTVTLASASWGKQSLGWALITRATFLP